MFQTKVVPYQSYTSQIAGQQRQAIAKLKRIYGGIASHYKIGGMSQVSGYTPLSTANDAMNQLSREGGLLFKLEHGQDLNHEELKLVAQCQHAVSFFMTRLKYYSENSRNLNKLTKTERPFIQLNQKYGIDQQVQNALAKTNVNLLVIDQQSIAKAVVGKQKEDAEQKAGQKLQGTYNTLIRESHKLVLFYKIYRELLYKTNKFATDPATKAAIQAARPSVRQAARALEQLITKGGLVDSAMQLAKAKRWTDFARAVQRLIPYLQVVEAFEKQAKQWSKQIQTRKLGLLYLQFVGTCQKKGLLKTEEDAVTKAEKFAA